MIVLDKPAMTRLARALRAELGAIGIVVGHQTSLNLAIEAIGLGSPNAALAMLDRCAVLLDLDEIVRDDGTSVVYVTRELRIELGLPDHDDTVGRALAQFVRLCAHEHAVRSAIGGRPLVPQVGDVLGLDGFDAGVLLAAACVACDLRFYVDGMPLRLRLPLHARIGTDGHPPFRLEANAGDVPFYRPVILHHVGTRMDEAVSRLRPDLPLPQDESTRAARLAIVVLKALASIERSMDPAGGRWKAAIEAAPVLDAHGKPSWLSVFATSVLARFQELGLVAALLEGKGIRHLGRLRSDGAAGPENETFPQEGPGTRSMPQFCTADIDGVPRIGCRLFMETRDGNAFHVFDFGGALKHVDLMYGEFRWLEGAAAGNGATRFALRSMLAHEAVKPLHGDIEAFLATPLREDGPEGGASALMAQAITAMNEANGALGGRHP